MRAMFDAGRLLVISPHLDDGALGCGVLLTAAVSARVVTVYTGMPAGKPVLTKWDRDCGFDDSHAAMRARLAEDARAMAILGAEAEHLPFLDSQYAPLPGRERLAKALARTIDAYMPDVVALPLGLHHCDHERVREAALLLLPHRPRLLWLGYEDELYRYRAGVLQRVLGRLARRRIHATPIECAGRGDPRRKRLAIQAYASQLRAIGINTPGAGIEAPERYWWLDTGRIASGGDMPGSADED
ncbi:PIG-L deacetylase family protein [Bordetella sp. LUAb4]|uniref:PIG-L deacetylase family protein n=1 Tax=Bordetella sp. LUAb4 TaxID=2843195 RepID=UPI001E51B6A7|nr:PIG-L family deacetylase [Bordetella sp. LUAb4]